MRFKWTFWRAVFVLVLLSGLYGTFRRFTGGLAASTNLSDAFPWGIWIGFDVLCGVMLAAGGFTLMAAVHIFNVERFKPIVRPTLLTAFLGYTLVCVALMFDLGRFWNIWHPLVMWNPHSVMFEVGWCVMLYTAVLALEFAPVLLERLQLMPEQRVARAADAGLRTLKLFALPIVVAGVLLSTLHQSSLGTLYLIFPTKLYPLWYSPLLPFQFFISAIGVGLAMTIFESHMSARHFGRHLELPLLRELGRILVVVLMLYGVLRFQDLYHRHALGLILVPRMETWMFLLEIALCLAIPLAMLLTPRIRNSERGLYVAAVITLLGFVANRLNVSLTGMEAASGVHYFPKFAEVAVTASIVAVGFAVFSVVTRYLPIFESAGELVARERRAAAERAKVQPAARIAVAPQPQPEDELVAP
jgi:Ni/Fe-hydrogenase subunit HybB-like protein